MLHERDEAGVQHPRLRGRWKALADEEIEDLGESILADEVIDEIASGMPSLDSQIEPIDFGQVDATGVSLHRGLLLGCRGQNVKFSGVDLLRASVVHTEFLESDFTNANFQSTNVVLDSSLARSNFQGAKLTASFFREVDLSACDMRGADLSNSNFGLGFYQMLIQ
jgi:uncharacterized protein YjbI with pentapeptide repeats